MGAQDLLKQAPVEAQDHLVQAPVEAQDQQALDLQVQVETQDHLALDLVEPLEEVQDCQVPVEHQGQLVLDHQTLKAHPRKIQEGDQGEIQTRGKNSRILKNRLSRKLRSSISTTRNIP